MLTREDLTDDLHELARQATALAGRIDQMSKADFLEAMESLKARCDRMRADVIRHSRQLGRGMRDDGGLDLRFLANRKQLLKTDLRYSR